MHDLLDSVEIHPDDGAYGRLERRRRRRDQRRRAGALMLAFMLGALATVAVVEVAGTQVTDTHPAVEPDAIETVHRSRMSSSVAVALRPGWILEEHRRPDGRVHTFTLTGPVSSGGAVQVRVWDLASVRPVDPGTGVAAPVGSGARWYRDALGERTTVDISSTLDSSLWRWYRPYELHWLADLPGVRSAIAQGDLRLHDVQVWSLALDRRSSVQAFVPDDRGSGTIAAGPSRYVLVADGPLVLLMGVTPVGDASIDDAWASAWEEISTIRWRP